MLTNIFSAFYLVREWPLFRLHLQQRREMTSNARAHVSCTVHNFHVTQHQQYRLMVSFIQWRFHPLIFTSSLMWCISIHSYYVSQCPKWNVNWIFYLSRAMWIVDIGSDNNLCVLIQNGIQQNLYTIISKSIKQKKTAQKYHICVIPKRLLLTINGIWAQLNRYWKLKSWQL